jgi:hypothetical protein
MNGEFDFVFDGDGGGVLSTRNDIVHGEGKGGQGR